MYKLLICDDEYFVVKGLRETIDWGALDIEIVGDCKNGKQALEAVDNLHPDLIISDIRMPIMDGLQMAEALAKKNFNGAIIIYSGYGDFEYARKALEYGVTSYLLKPVDNNTLTQKVKDAIATLEAERVKRSALHKYEMGLPILRKNFVEKLLAGDEPMSSAEELRSLGITLPRQGLVIRTVQIQMGGGALSQSVASFCNGLLTALSSFNAVECLHDEDFTVITDMTDVSVLCDCIKSLLNDESVTHGAKFAVGISEPYDGEENICKAYAKAHSLCTKILFPSINNLRVAGNDDASQYSQLVEDILVYISENYSGKASVRAAAEKLFVSESHIMHEMKDVLGKTFNECLTEYRIMKAKEMIAEGRLRVKEIADRVGYSDPRYFGKVFSDTTGMSPTEYADSVRK